MLLRPVVKLRFDTEMLQNRNENSVLYLRLLVKSLLTDLSKALFVIIGQGSASKYLVILIDF